MPESTNAQLAAEIRAGNFEDRAWVTSALERSADRIEALAVIIMRQEQIIESYETHPPAPKREANPSGCYVNGCITDHEEGAAHVPEFNPHA